ncbi:MAG: ABATE domain-containing protein [Hyphomicrobiales bacterium]|nr:ABATE domain-containing protein [Hyphomicrobiales bacterium]
MAKIRPGDRDKAGDEELALRFVNTLAWRNAKSPEERLPDAEALLDWLAGAQGIEPQALSRLRKRGERRQVEAEAVYHQALELREALSRLFLARGQKLSPSSKDLHILNRILGASRPRIAAVPSATKGAASAWRLAPSEGEENEILAPIAWSAAELLTGPRGMRVRQCEDERGCGAVFLDQSRLNNRRWCSMGDCGNRAKARRHYLRKKQASGRKDPR